MANTKLIEQCQEAIKAFFRARSVHEDLDLTEIGEDWSRSDAESLAERGDEGLRYGAGSSGDLKLRFTNERGFYLNRNGMDPNEFLVFQRIVAYEFASVGLPFHNMSS